MKRAATLGPIGYLRASGTIASIITLICVIILPHVPEAANLLIIIITAAFAHAILKYTRQNFTCCDPKEIVIDEVLGTLIAVFGFKINTPAFFCSFILFRFFDITKVWGIKKLENAFNWQNSILIDDIIAALYANILTHFMIYVFN